MKTSQDGIDLIKYFEGLRLEAYQCPAGIWTIGYGTTRGVSKGMTITAPKAEELLREDLETFEKTINECVKVPITQKQFDALACFCYNIGSGALKKSTLLKKLNAGDFTGAAQQFLVWNKAGGKTLAGLTRRREAEVALFQEV